MWCLKIPSSSACQLDGAQCPRMEKGRAEVKPSSKRTCHRWSSWEGWSWTRSMCFTGWLGPSQKRFLIYMQKFPLYCCSQTFWSLDHLHCTQRVMCSPAGEQADRDYVPWAAASVASHFSVPKAGCSDPKTDLVKDGQKTSLKGVWREKESSSKGKYSSAKFQCTRSLSSAYILPTHRLISAPGSLAPCQWECRFWQFVQSAVRNCS